MLVIFLIGNYKFGCVNDEEISFTFKNECKTLKEIAWQVATVAGKVGLKKENDMHK